MQAKPREGGAVAESAGRTVTLLFSDIEGSTRLVRRLGEQDYGKALAEHRGVLRVALEEHDGVEVDCRADEWFAVFPSSRSLSGRDSCSCPWHPIRRRWSLFSQASRR